MNDKDFGRPISDEEFLAWRAEAIAYFRYMGREHAKKVMGGTPIGDHNIKMIFGGENDEQKT